MQYQSVQYQTVNLINRYAMQYHVKFRIISLFNYVTDSIINLQIQLAPDAIITYMDTMNWVIWVKMVLNSSTS
jgi:hypothetical protein